MLPAGTNADTTDGGLAAAVKSRTAHVIHLTHNDLDAVGADAIHRIKFGNGNVFTIWSSVGKFAALFSLVASCEGKGDLLSISDLGYQKDTERMARLARTHGWKVEWRDHHRWREDEINKVSKEVEVLHIDTSLCACGIVSRDLAPENSIAKEIAHVVCDYDLWKHSDPRSAILGQVLQRKKNREHVRDCLAAGIFSDDFIAGEYAGIRAEMDFMVHQSLNHATIAGTRYKIVFAPLYGYPSETAHFIRNELKTDIEVIISKDGKFSIRSVPPISHLIAREFGGGGHPNAAGGSFRFSLVERFTWWLLKRSRHFTVFISVAERY